jgi:molybdopterin-guanine dinucleotide biosynthesis protein A
LSEADLDPNPDAAGFVLAGGRSSRMGEDKALVNLAGQPLVVHALGILRGAGLAASLAGGSSALAALAPLVQDSQPGLGPLGGICAALASTAARRAVFLPIDLPLLPASLIAYLRDHARITGSSVTVSSVNGFAQTFPAVLDRAALPLLEAELEAGRGGCFSGFQAAAGRLGRQISVVPVEMLVQSGHAAHPEGLPAARWFLNVNSPEGLRLAHEYGGQAGSGKLGRVS